LKKLFHLKKCILLRDCRNSGPSIDRTTLLERIRDLDAIRSTVLVHKQAGEDVKPLDVKVAFDMELHDQLGLCSIELREAEKIDCKKEIESNVEL
jgi:hypothetical protein